MMRYQPTNKITEYESLVLQIVIFRGRLSENLN